MNNEKMDIRSMVAVLTNSVNNMCNTKSVEDVNNEFLKIKDMIINIYKYNMDRVNKGETK